jgi:aminoglycoside 6'-N-acetyltransferase
MESGGARGVAFFIGMEELIRDGDLALRRMRNNKSDYELMAKWLTDPRVLEFYEGRDNPFPLARIVNEYSTSVLYSQGVTPCFLISKGGPIGYLQFCPVASGEDLLSYGLEATDAASNIFGLDQFIGEPEYWDRGIGTRAIRLMLVYLFHSKQAAAAVVDPHVENLRAIHCYEKCGFRKIKLLAHHELHEGVWSDSWLMRAEP